MRENCTYSLSGGRWLARKRATSDPTPAKRLNEGQGGPKEIVEGRLLAKENAKPPIPAPDTVPNEWANAWMVGVRDEAYASQR